LRLLNVPTDDGALESPVAPLFVKFVSVEDGATVLDVGCGTGSLSATLAGMTAASKIVGVDRSITFIEYARRQIVDPRVNFQVGDAQNLPYVEGSFDRSMALLVVNFIPDAQKAAREMRRVTNAGGRIALAMCDGSRANRLNDSMWDAAIAIDPTVKRPSQRPGSYSSAEALADLLRGAA
jgi:ubiquinone/menaquinone biosynthesis C-methylase UbiE